MPKGKVKDFFRKQFSPTKGGTILGNLARKAGDIFTGGAVSSMFPVPQKDSQLAVELRNKGVIKDDPNSDEGVKLNENSGFVGRRNADPSNDAKPSFMQKCKDWVDANKKSFYGLLALPLVFLGIFQLLPKKKRRR